MDIKILFDKIRALATELIKYPNNLESSKLFTEVLREVKMDILPIRDIEILLYALRSVPFTNEGVCIIESLTGCMKYQLYGKSGSWNCRVIASRLQKLRDLIMYDYIIEGSLIIYSNNQIKWDLDILFIH